MGGGGGGFVYPTPTNCIVLELGEKLWKKWEFDLYHWFSALK